MHRRSMCQPLFLALLASDMAIEETCQPAFPQRGIRSFSLHYTGGFMKRNLVSFRSNARLARQLWGEPSRIALRGLRELTARYSLSVAAGDLQLLEGRWYVTHSGLLQLASRRGCRGISRYRQNQFSDPTTSRWVFKAIVYKAGPLEVSSATETPIHPTRPPWFEAPKCASPKREPLIGPYEKLTESASAVWKSSDRSPHRKSPSPSRRLRTATALPMASPDCGTSSAC